LCKIFLPEPNLQTNTGVTSARVIGIDLLAMLDLIMMLRDGVDVSVAARAHFERNVIRLRKKTGLIKVSDVKPNLTMDLINAQVGLH